MITAGTDTYGRVKQVGKTPIVTKFVMVNIFPIFPLESFYFVGMLERDSQGVPLFFDIRTSTVHGLPLARIDKLSVMMAYARGICGALTLIGVCALVPGIMYLTGEHFDWLAILLTKIWIGSFVSGTILGTCTYVMPLQTSQREKAIRRLCGKVLGICADPAMIREDTARTLKDRLDPNFGLVETSEDLRLVKQLADVRFEIALGGPPIELEFRTDDLLHAIEKQEFQTGEDASSLR